MPAAVMPSYADTIAAIATPPGAGGIAILRISGPEAGALLSRLFRPRKRAARTQAKLQTEFSFAPRHMHYGHVLDSHGERLDDVLAVFMPGPYSATGEDVGEIHCHGGPGVTAALLEAALEAGARLAGPGEFTRRAFLNGRMDLTQAEAVAEIISASTHEGVRLAAAKLDGALAVEVRSVRDALDALRIQVTLTIDFPDEEAELLSRPMFAGTVRECMEAIRRLLSAFDRARLWREGAVAVLAGRVNAGKSSLLNALLGRERAIVSPEPGTTRDYIEETVHIRGIPLRVIDTAGLREGGDVVESEGIRRSRDLAANADILVFVTDVSVPVHPEERDFLSRNISLLREGRLLLALNKLDALEPVLGGETTRGAALARGRAFLMEALGNDPEAAAVSLQQCFLLSTKLGSGLDDLTQGLEKALRALGGEELSEGDLAPNLRQAQLLREALGDLEELWVALENGHPPDILSVHLESAAYSLASVTGVLDDEGILDTIFASFCIGK